MEVLRTGFGNSHHRRICLRAGRTAAVQKEDFHSRSEQRSQSRSQGFVQSRGDPGQRDTGTVSGVLPALAGQRYQADHGASHPGTQDRSYYAGTVEERRKLRRRETEITSRLSVSGYEPCPSPVSLSPVVVDRFLRRSGSRVSILMACRRTVPHLALSLCVIPIPSRTTRKSY